MNVYNTKMDLVFAESKMLLMVMEERKWVKEVRENVFSRKNITQKSS